MNDKAIDVLVAAGPHDRTASPVWLTLPSDCPSETASALTVTDERGTQSAAQIDLLFGGSGEARLVWIVRDLPAGAQRRYSVTAEGAGDVSNGGGTPSGGAGVTVKEAAAGRLDVAVSGAPFTTYYHGPDVVRPYLHPLLGPSGLPVTRLYPMVQDAPGETKDHPHHRGFYVAHGDVNGADHWSEGPSRAIMRHTGFRTLASGSVCGGFEETLEWRDREDSATIVSETRRFTFFDLGDAGTAGRVFDVALRFRAGAEPVTFGDTKEGGLISVLVASSMDGPTKQRPDAAGVIESAHGGRTEDECWGRRAMWCDYSGPVGGETVGICLMDHPDNPHYPTYWREAA